MILYLNTFRRTSVADVAVIFARAPFLTALLGWLWLGVREARIGVSIMVNGAVADGHLIGDILAFGMTLLMAIMNADHSPAARDAHAAGCLSLGLLFRDSSDGRLATGPDGRLNWPKLGLARA
jgi:drug/metabolite transporter (DMT)-like permease